MCQEVVERKEEVLNLKAQIAIYAFLKIPAIKKRLKFAILLFQPIILYQKLKNLKFYGKQLFV